MPDILIRGMEMPESCADCPICYDMMECSVSPLRFWNGKTELEQFEFCNERHPSCPLVELQEHGDLIDICNAENALFVAGNYHLNDYKKGWNDGIKAVIENAPVIVPASEEATNG